MRPKDSFGIWLNETEFMNFSDPQTQSLLGVKATHRRFTGSDIFRTLMNILPNPDKILKTNNLRMESYRDLRIDTSIRTSMGSRRAGTERMTGKIDTMKASADVTTLIDNVFKNLKTRRIVSEIVEAVYYGYNVSEIYWQRDGNYILPKDIVGKPQEWFAFDENRLPRFLTAEQPMNGEFLQHRKFLVTQFEATYTNPYGTPLLSSVYWPVQFKKNGLKLFLRFLDKYGLPYLLGTQAQGIDDANELLDMLDGLRQDGVGILPRGSEAKLLDATGTSSAELFRGLREDCRAEIFETIVGHSASVVATPGKLGSDNTALEVRQDLIDADATLAQEAMNQVIRWIVDVNFPTVKDYPEWKLVAPEGLKKDRAERDKLIADTKQVRFTKKYYMTNYGYAEDEIEEVTGTQPAFADPNAVEVKEPQSQFTAADGQAAIDAITEQLLAHAESDSEKLLAPIAAMISAGKDYPSVSKQIAKMFGKMDTAGFEEIMGKALLLADTAGRVSV